jgi:hypothetical protein
MKYKMIVIVLKLIKTTKKGDFKMRSKTKYILVIFLVAFSLFFVTTGVYAADVTFAKVNRTGFYPNITPDSSGGIVFLDDTEDIYWTGSRMFYISNELGNQGLAVALTALSSDRTVFVRIGGSAGASPVAGSLINIIYINE